MLNRVEPLQNELQALSEAAQENITKNANLSSLIADLEKSIARYELEYAELISQAQAIKSDLISVEKKVERSVALLQSLSSRFKFNVDFFSNSLANRFNFHNFKLKVNKPDGRRAVNFSKLKCQQ